MGAPKKIDAFRKSLTDDDLAGEDTASRSRMAGYEAMQPGPARTAALESEAIWREELGLDPIEVQS